MALLSDTSRSHIGRLASAGARAGLIILLHCVVAAQPLPHEREVHAVFLLNLARFVRWPDKAFASDDAPLVIGILPDEPLATILEEAAAGESVGRHAMVVRRIQTAADLSRCHIVHFPRARIADAVPLIAQLHGTPVLLVSDADGFLRLGGHVQMFNRGGQVKLRLDVENLQRAELTASSQLLRVAEIVKK